MIKEAIQALVDLSNGQVLSAASRFYTRHKLESLPSPASTPKALGLHTLEGVVAYVKEELSRDWQRRVAAGLQVGKPDVYIIVDDPAHLTMLSNLYGEFAQRDVYAEAAPFLPEAFPYGRFIDTETFVTRLQTCFVQDDSTAKILKVVGNITGEVVQTVEDDGVTQVVAARAGLTKIQAVDVPNPVRLCPFRTFPEVPQPSSAFVLRMKRAEDGGMPTAALFLVEDGLWKLTAVRAIRDYLGDLGLTVIA